MITGIDIAQKASSVKIYEMVPLIPKALILSFRDTVDSLSTSDDGGVDVDEDDVDEVDDDEDDDGDVEDDDVIDDDAADDDILDSLSFD
jgi:hypothetical protein